MDEPFGALDPITRAEIQLEFKKLQEKLSKTIVFVTHDVGEALMLGDRIAIDGSWADAEHPHAGKISAVARHGGAGIREGLSDGR